MSDCEICRNYIPCKSENKDKVDKCFFVYLTEEYLAKDTKEYAIGYKQGIADERERIVAELREKSEKSKDNLKKFMDIGNIININYYGGKLNAFEQALEIVRGNANE